MTYQRFDAFVHRHVLIQLVLVTAAIVAMIALTDALFYLLSLLPAGHSAPTHYGHLKVGHQIPPYLPSR